MTFSFIVTGGSKGLGPSIADAALREGFDVALIARNPDLLEETRKKLSASFPDRKVSAHPCDLTEPERVNWVIADIREQHSDVVCLVNNAATWTGGVAFRDADHDIMQRSIDLNFFSAFNASKAVLESHEGDELAIINIGATASTRGSAKMAPIAVAKSALRTLSQSMARELGPEGVHVAHVIIDGLLDNPRTRELSPDIPEDRFIQQQGVAKDVVRIARQDRSAWTFEWDVRPSVESW